MRYAVLLLAVLGVGLAAGWEAGRGTLSATVAGGQAEAAGVLPESGGGPPAELLLPDTGPRVDIPVEAQVAKPPAMPPERTNPKVARDTFVIPRARDDEVYSFRGWIFHDSNGNGVRDRHEPPAAGEVITIPGSGIDAVSGADGRYELCCFREGVYDIMAQEARISVNTADARHIVIEPLNLALP